MPTFKDSIEDEYCEEQKKKIQDEEYHNFYKFNDPNDLSAMYWLGS